MLFDVLMAVGDTESTTFATYLHGWRQATGQPFDSFRLRLGIAWAKAFVNATYCGAVAERFSRRNGETMIRTAEQAYDELRTLLATA